MASVIKWDSGWSSAGTDVIGTEANSLAAGSYAAGTTVYDNSTNLNQYGKIVVTLNTVTPTSAGPYVQVHMLTAPDGANYDQAPAAANPSNHNVIAVLPLDTTAAATKRVMSAVFPLQPCKTTFVLYNGSGGAFSSSGNTVTLYVNNDEAT